MIFGRSRLERLILMCQRAGVKRFFIEADDLDASGLRASLGSFHDHLEINFVGSFVQVLEQLPADAPCIALRGNLVLAASQLRELLANQAARPGEVVSVESTDSARGGSLTAGPLGRRAPGPGPVASQPQTSRQGALSLDGRPAGH